MAIIYTYPIKATPADDDLILISDSESTNPKDRTKQIRVSSLPGGSSSGVSSFNTLTGAVTITGGTNVTLNTTGNNIEINASGGSGGSVDCWKIINGTSSNIIASQPADEGTFTVSNDTSMEILGNGSDELKFVLGVPNATKKGGITAVIGPTQIPSQSTSGTWYPVDFVEADASRLAVRVPTGSGSSGVDSVTTTNGTFINLTPTSATTGAVTVTADLSAVDGTATTGTKFLTKDNEWAVPTYTTAYSLPLAANGTRGGIQIGYTQTGKNYPVQLDSEQAYVNVPWTDTVVSPGSPANSVQFNNSGAFGGSLDLTFSSNTLTVKDNIVIRGNGTSNAGKLRLECYDNTNTHYIDLIGPDHGGGAASYSVKFPATGPGGNNKILESNSSGDLSWIDTPSAPSAFPSSVASNASGSFTAVYNTFHKVTTDGTYPNVVVTLPATGQTHIGKIIGIKWIAEQGGGATNTVIIKTPSSVQIDSDTNSDTTGLALGAVNNYYEFITDGQNWWIK